LDLRDYLRVLRKGWLVILAFLVVGLGIGVVLTLTTSKVYEASVQVFVATSGDTSTAALAQGQTYVQDEVQSLTSFANSPRVTGPVIQKSKLSLTQNQLAGKITADAPLNKTLINLHVTDHSPQTATKLANAVAAEFATVVTTAVQSDQSGQPVVKLTVVHPATVPGAPIKPNKVLNIGLGFVIGLLVGIGVVILRDVLDNTIKGPQDFEELGLPVLGIVPFDKRTPRSPIAFRADTHGTRAEAYRQLRTNLQFVNVDQNPRIIAVTSGVPGEGKTTTAINLAAALAEGGYRVCLVEADLRRPTIAKALDLVPDIGFTTALIGKANVLDVLQNAGRNLAVLACGPVPPNPSELLITEQASALIKEIASHADYTIIDTAPLLPVADGAEVAALADATILVHHAGKSTRDQIERSIAALAKVDERPVGAVLNMVTRGIGGQGYNYAYYYSYRPDRSGHRQGDGAEANGSNGSNGSVPVDRLLESADGDSAGVGGRGPVEGREN
jgi:capsular exopolysaccharide synthesis family protein